MTDHDSKDQVRPTALRPTAVKISGPPYEGVIVRWPRRPAGNCDVEARDGRIWSVPVSLILGEKESTE